jgi:hypothetical protein
VVTRNELPTLFQSSVRSAGTHHLRSTCTKTGRKTCAGNVNPCTVYPLYNIRVIMICTRLFDTIHLKSNSPFRGYRVERFTRTSFRYENGASTIILGRWRFKEGKRRNDNNPKSICDNLTKEEKNMKKRNDTYTKQMHNNIFYCPLLRRNRCIQCALRHSEAIRWFRVGLSRKLQYKPSRFTVRDPWGNFMFTQKTKRMMCKSQSIFGFYLCRTTVGEIVW